MAYQDEYRRGRGRDEDFGRGGEQNRSDRWQNESYEQGSRFGQRGFESERYGRESNQGFGREDFGPSYGGETFGREQQYGREPYGQGFGQQRYGREFGGREQFGRGQQQQSRYGQGRFGQHGGYSEEGGYDPQRQGRQPYSGMGGELRESAGWAGEGYRRYGESYGRGPEGFDRETGSYGFGTGTSRTGGSQVGGDWQGFGGSRSFGSGSYSEGRGPQGFGGSFESERFGTPGRTRGRFTGRGPKGYSRSDDRIREDVSDRLEAHGEIDATEIEVRVEQGEVTLEGTVEDRRTKRLAEDIVEDLPGVKQVHNRIRVLGNGGERGGRSTATTGTTGTAGSSMEGSERAKGGSTTRSSTRT